MKIMSLSLLPLLTVVMLAFVPLSYAATDDKDAAMEKAAQDEIAQGNNPHLSKLVAKAKELGENLDRMALAHLYTMREAYGVLRAVEIVRRDVDVAVKACGKANPDMRKAMNDRFTVWTGKIDPVVEAKQAEIDIAIRQQDYAMSKDINDYFKLIRQTAEYANRNIDKQVITTPEACTSLLESMDRTEDVVATLLADIVLLSWPPEPEAPRQTQIPNR